MVSPAGPFTKLKWDAPRIAAPSNSSCIRSMVSSLASSLCSVNVESALRLATGPSPMAWMVMGPVYRWSSVLYLNRSLFMRTIKSSISESKSSPSNRRISCTLVVNLDVTLLMDSPEGSFINEKCLRRREGGFSNSSFTRVMVRTLPSRISSLNGWSGSRVAASMLATMVNVLVSRSSLEFVNSPSLIRTLKLG